MTIEQRCPHCHQLIGRQGLANIVAKVVLDANKIPVEVIKRLIRRKTKATDKEIYNALGGLVRRGRIRRFSYGEYGAPSDQDVTGAK